MYGNIFKITTAKKVQEFDFTSFECDKEVIRFIQIAIDILRQNLPQQILLFDEVCETDCTNNNSKSITVNTEYSIPIFFVLLRLIT